MAKVERETINKFYNDKELGKIAICTTCTEPAEVCSDKFPEDDGAVVQANEALANHAKRMKGEE